MGSPAPTLDVTDAARCSRRCAGATVINCAAYTDVDGAEAESEAATPVNADGARNVAEAAGARDLRLDRLRLRRREARAVRRVRPVGAALGVRPLEARGRASHRGRERGPASSCAPRGCSAPAARNFVDDDARAGRASAGSSGWWTTRSAAPPSPATSPMRSSRSRAATSAAFLHVAGRARARGSSSPRDLRARRRGRRMSAPARPRSSRVPRPPGQLGARRASAARPSCPPGRTASTPIWGCAREAARDRRRRLHRLDLRAPLHSGEHEIVVLDKLTYAGPARERAGGRRARRRRHRGPRRWSGRWPTGVRRGRELRRRVARGPLDRRPGRVRAHARDRHGRAARRGARAAACRATSRCRPTRSTARSRRARSPRRSPLDPSSPYSATKAAGRPAGLGAPPHLRHRGGDLPRLEQLRPAPVPREADPAVDPERAARRPAAGLRRRPPGAQLALRRGLLPRHRHRAARAAGRARPTTSAAPTSARTSTWCTGSSS